MEFREVVLDALANDYLNLPSIRQRLVSLGTSHYLDEEHIKGQLENLVMNYFVERREIPHKPLEFEYRKQIMPRGVEFRDGVWVLIA